ncbi:transposase IS3 family protein [Ruegeria lacuscaerulensis ITI-1157]|nr:transposase IS3 family protein [Ruegeria lacuscaerulensis ITI-1157]SHJ78700.1 hypothetical protein SAMN05444404_2664 [Ruegeria lacuscaerulensis ITI-1157]
MYLEYEEGIDASTGQASRWNGRSTKLAKDYAGMRGSGVRKLMQLEDEIGTLNRLFECRTPDKTRRRDALRQKR